MAFGAEAAAVAAKDEVPPLRKESDNTTSETAVPSSHKVPQLRQDATSTSSAGTGVLRLTFGGRTVFEHRSSSSPCSFHASSTSSASCQAECPPQPVVPSRVPSSHKVPQLRQDATNTSSAGTGVFRLTFGGRTVFEHRNSSRPCSFNASSTFSASCQAEYPPQPVVPGWVRALASRLHEAEELPWFLMSKKVTKTDLDGDENPLLIPACFVKANIMPRLSEDEKKAASLDGYPKKRMREMQQSSEEEAEEMQQSNPELQLQSCKRRKTMEKGRQHGGLQVTAWTMSRWRFESLRLTCWDHTNGTVLKGGHLKYLFDRSFLRQGDHVQLWGFRDARRQLQLALHKATSTSSSSHACME